MNEKWVDCPEAEHMYEVSSLGRVRKKSSGRIVKGFKSRIGYIDYYLYLGESPKKRIIRKAHRLVATAFIENPNLFKEVNHIDGNKNNNSMENLEWTTRSDNMYHALKEGLKIPKKGIEVHTSKVTEEQVYEIRELGKTLSFIEIAKIYNITATTASRICSRKTWRHLK